MKAEEEGKTKKMGPKLHEILKTRNARTIFSQIIIVLILSMGGTIFLAPFLWMVSVSLSSSANLGVSFPLRWIPHDLGLINYKMLFANVPMLRYYLNSLIVTGASSILRVFFSCLAGYAFAKGRFPGQKVLLILVLASMMIPMEITMIPLFLFFRKIGLMNSYTGIILPSIVYAFGIFLATQFMKKIPSELLEAARMDGCNEFWIFSRIVLPLSGPLVSTLIILSFMDSWNDLLWPLIIINQYEKYTVTLGLAMISAQAGGETLPLVGTGMASTVIAVMPVILIFLALQKYFVKGITMTGLKG